MYQNINVRATPARMSAIAKPNISILNKFLAECNPANY